MATDAFLRRQLGLEQFDRFYVPGGGGALASSGKATVDAYRAEVNAAGEIVFSPMQAKATAVARP